MSRLVEIFFFSNSVAFTENLNFSKERSSLIPTFEIFHVSEAFSEFETPIQKLLVYDPFTTYEVYLLA